MESDKFDITNKDNTYILTPKDHKIEQTVIFLHGWGQKGAQWINYLKDGSVTPEGTKIVVPTAPRRMITFSKKENHAWFDFYTLKQSTDDPDVVGNYIHVEESVKFITKLIDREVNELGGDAKKVFIVGFSQGGTVGGYTFKQYTKPLGGLVVYSTPVHRYVPEGPFNTYSPVLWIHGLDDKVVEYEVALYHNACLENGKRKFVHIKLEKLGHQTNDVCARETKKFIESCLTKPKL